MDWRADKLECKQKKFAVTGAVPWKRSVYVERQEDRSVLRLLKDGENVNLRAGRQSGKTSLMLRASDLLQKEGHLCVEVELSSPFLKASLRESLARVEEKILYNLSSLQVTTSSILRSKTSGVEGFCNFLRELATLAPENRLLYLLFDELDMISRFSSQDIALFFMSLKDLFRNKNLPVRILMVSVLSPTELIMNKDTGGIGINFMADVQLPLFENTKFVRSQIISQGFCDEDRKEIDKILKEVINLTGGQPHLTSKTCYELQNADDKVQCWEKMKNDALDPVNTWARSHLEGIRKQFLDMGTRFLSVSQTLGEIIDKRRPKNMSNLSTLLNAGIIVRRGSNHVLANPIYVEHLDRQWLDELEEKQETQLLGSPAEGKMSSSIFKKKIAILLCGGTIGMIQEGKRAVFENDNRKLDEFTENELSNIAEIELINFDPKDGINMVPERWIKIAKYIYRNRKRYEGFVVAHGTDTLSFTASAVAFMLGRNFDRPVVFTASQATIDVIHGDMKVNLIRSCYAAAHPDAVREVQILFGDKIMRAVRAVKSDDRTFDGFDTPGKPPLGRVTEELLIGDYVEIGRRKGRISFMPYLAREMMYITLVPGLRAERFRSVLDDKLEGEAIDGIVISTPGVGNIPSEKPYSFRPFIRDSVAAGIPVLITSQVPINPYTQEQYEMASVPAELGAIPAGNMTISAAYTKFSWVIGCVKNEARRSELDRARFVADVKSRMFKNYIGEQAEAV